MISTVPNGTILKEMGGNTYAFSIFITYIIQDTTIYIKFLI